MICTALIKGLRDFIQGASLKMSDVFFLSGISGLSFDCALPCCSFCLVMFLLMVDFPDLFFSRNSPVFLIERQACVRARARVCVCVCVCVLYNALCQLFW